MSPDPLASERQRDEVAWEEIELLLDEVGRLAKTELQPRPFETKFLDAIVQAVAAVGGAIWAVKENGNLDIEYDVNLSSAIATDAAAQQSHSHLIENLFHGGQPRLLLPGANDGQAINSTTFLLVACPIRVDGAPKYFVEILLHPDARPSVQRGFQRVIVAACELAEDFYQRQQLRDLKQQEAWLLSLVHFSDLLQSSSDLRQTAYTIANEGRRLTSADRVSVLLYRGKRTLAVAISGVDLLDRRANPVRLLEKLATNTLRYGEPLWYPPAPENSPPEIEAALQAQLDESHARTLTIVLLQTGSETNMKTIGALVAERFDGQIDDDWKPHVSAVARRSASALANALEFENIPFRFIWRTWQRAAWWAQPQQLPKTVVWFLLIALAVAALIYVPADFTVLGRGELQPARRHHIFAAVDGVVAELPVKNEAHVHTGDLLVSLQSLPFDLQFSAVAGKRRTTQEELNSAETERLKNGANQPDVAGQMGVTTRIEQLKETLRELDQEFKILQEQRQQMEVRSPMDGVVLTWDVDRLLASRPVQRGERLLTVADLAGPWELELKITDEQAGHLREAYANDGPDLPVTFILGSVPGTEYTGTLKRIAESAEVDEAGSPVVRVSVAVSDSETSTFRPGASVVARIHCGRRSIGYVWFHELWEVLQAKLFF